MLQCSEDNVRRIPRQERVSLNSSSRIGTAIFAARNGACRGHVGFANRTLDHLFGVNGATAVCRARSSGFALAPARLADGAIFLHPRVPLEAIPGDNDGGDGKQQLC